MVSYKEAMELALAATKKQIESEVINIEEALSRVVVKDIYATRDLPPFDNSAMDGYAFKYNEKRNRYKIAGTVFAGDKESVEINEDECYKIMTGAIVPKSCDTVVPKELTLEENGYMLLQKSISKGNAVRLKGEELSKGSLILEKGEKLTPAKIALLASQGIVEVAVYRKISIAIASTGNELKEPHELADESEIYNINAINIKMHLKAAGFDAIYLGSIPDDMEQSLEFTQRFKAYDVAITTGGISKGEADYTRKAFMENGLKVLFSGVNLKPGHPTLFGTMGSTFIMAMPGNPLAAILNVLILGMPVLLKRQGAKEHFYKTISVEMGKSLQLKGNRLNIVLGRVVEGKFYPYKNNKYGSGMISPLVASNAIALFSEDIKISDIGDRIEVIEI